MNHQIWGYIIFRQTQIDPLTSPNWEHPLTLREGCQEGSIFAVFCVFFSYFMFIYIVNLLFCLCLFSIFVHITLFLLHCYLLYISFGSGSSYRIANLVGVEMEPISLVLRCFFLQKQTLNRSLASSKSNLYSHVNMIEYACIHIVVLQYPRTII